MKQWICLLCMILLLCGCAQAEPDRAEAVREEILALPSVEEFSRMDTDARREAYNRTQQVYETYQALSEAEKERIPEAEEMFGALFSWFNDQVQPLTGT